MCLTLRVVAFRRPCSGARKEQTPSRGNGSHPARHPEHVNTDRPRDRVDTGQLSRRT